MPPRFAASSGPLSPAVKENRTQRIGVNNGFVTPSNSLRRVVKPLGEHKPDNCSPNLDYSPQQEQQKTTPKVDKASKGEEKPAPDDKASKGKHSSLARDILSRRVGHNSHGPCSLASTLKVDVGPRHKGLETSSTDRASESSLKRSSQSGSIRHGRGMMMGCSNSGSRSKGETEGLSACKKHIVFPTSLVKDSPKKQKLCVKSFKGEDLNEWFAAQSTPVRVKKGNGQDAKTPPSQRSTSPEFVNRPVKTGSSTGKSSQVDLSKHLATTVTEPATTPAFKRGKVDFATERSSCKEFEPKDDENHEVMLLPQPSKSPELKRRGGGPVACGSHGSDVSKESGRKEDTPPPLPTNSPEFVKRGLVPGAGGCFGAGPIAGPEGVGVVRDRRKCKPRGILIIDADSLGSSGSSATSSELQSVQMMSVPAMASVEWMVAEDYASETLQHPGMDVGTESDALNVGPTMLTSALCDVVRFEEEALPGEEPVDNNYNVTGKDGCLHQLSRLQMTESSGLSLSGLSLSDSNRQMPPLNVRSSAVLHGDFMRQSLTFMPTASRLGASAILRPMQEIPSSPQSIGWSPMSTVDSPPEETALLSHQCDISMVDVKAKTQVYATDSSVGRREEFVGDGELRDFHVDNTVQASSWICLPETSPSSSNCYPQETFDLLSINPLLCCINSSPPSDLCPTPAQMDVLQRRSMSCQNSGGQSPLCELLDSKDGGFEFQSPLTEGEISPVKSMLPNMDCSPMDSEADTVLGASPSNMSSGFSGSLCTVNTPGSGTCVESHPVPPVEEAVDCSSRGTDHSMQRLQVGSSGPSQDRREQVGVGKKNSKFQGGMYDGLQKDLMQSTLLWSADEILSMNQKEIGRRVLDDLLEEELENELAVEVERRKAKRETAQQAENADSSGKTEAGGSSKGGNLDGALKLKPELLISALAEETRRLAIKDSHNVAESGFSALPSGSFCKFLKTHNGGEDGVLLAV
ncbi:hypothetical protein BDL97_03G099100 [Sphagnum fallax]|nr:hypothetical protein BDL97_03G099100 [Sphagnum fallax]